MEEIYVIAVQLVISLTRTTTTLAKLAQPLEERNAFSALVQLVYFVMWDILEHPALLA